jgi:hypothetical protein
MPRVYPPAWCHEPDCKKCDFLKCDRRILSLLAPLKYSSLDSDERPKVVEITSIAVYFGFCQRLAKFFLLFPQDSPVPVVTNNFINSNTGLPTTVSIQRILLDMLDRGDPKAPTDEVHRIRLMLIFKATKRKVGRMIIGSEDDVEVKVSDTEIDAIVERVRRWQYDLSAGKLVNFEKTSRIDRCVYCFLDDCERF